MKHPQRPEDDAGGEPAREPDAVQQPDGTEASTALDLPKDLHGTEERELLVRLDDATLTAKAVRMGELLGEIEQIDAAFAAQREAHKAQVGVRKEELDGLGRIMRERAQTAVVPCERRINWPERRMEVYRLDTGDCIESRELTEDELQTELFRRTNPEQHRAQRKGRDRKRGAS